MIYPTDIVKHQEGTLGISSVEDERGFLDSITAATKRCLLTRFLISEGKLQIKVGDTDVKIEPLKNLYDGNKNEDAYVTAAAALQYCQIFYQYTQIGRANLSLAVSSGTSRNIESAKSHSNSSHIYIKLDANCLHSSQFAFLEGQGKVSWDKAILQFNNGAEFISDNDSRCSSNTGSVIKIYNFENLKLQSKEIHISYPSGTEKGNLGTIKISRN